MTSPTDTLIARLEEMARAAHDMADRYSRRGWPKSAQEHDARGSTLTEAALTLRQQGEELAEALRKAEESYELGQREVGPQLDHLRSLAREAVGALEVFAGAWKRDDQREWVPVTYRNGQREAVVAEDFRRASTIHDLLNKELGE